MRTIDFLSQRMDIELLKKYADEQDPRLFSDFIINEYSSIGFMEQDVNGKCVVDIGANIGLFSLLCFSKGAKKIISVEANPRIFCKLTDLIEKVSAFGTMIPINLAVMDGIVENVTISNAGPHSCVFEGNAPDAIGKKEENVSVAAVSLSDIVSLLPKGNDNFMKMDIEGAEYDTLLSSSARDIRVFSKIILECHPVKDKEADSPAPKLGRDSDILKTYLNHLGYSVEPRNQLFFWQYDQFGKPTSATPVKDFVGFVATRVR